MRAVSLMYHDVYSDADRGNLPATATLYHVSSDTFIGHLDAVQASERPVVTVADYLRGADNDSVMLTFDDGWAGTFNVGIPPILERGWQATIFVTRNVVGRQGFCTEDMLRQAARAGMEIGIHGTTHRMLSGCSADEITAEFSQCKTYLEALLDRPVEHASLPGGDSNRTIVECARAVGLNSLSTTRPGINTPRTPPFGLRRVAIRRTTSADAVARYCRYAPGREVARWRLLQLPCRLLGMRNYSRLRRWLVDRHQDGRSPDYFFEP